MRFDNVSRIIIDEFRIFGDIKHPGCGTRLENERIYKDIQGQLLIRENVDLSVKEIRGKWMRMKKWWTDHQKRVRHVSSYRCPENSERCIRMAFMSTCECYRNLYQKHQDEIGFKNLEPIIIIE